MALSAGLRRGELIGLRWEDVSLSERVLQVRRSICRTTTSATTDVYAHLLRGHVQDAALRFDPAAMTHLPPIAAERADAPIEP